MYMKSFSFFLLIFFQIGSVSQSASLHSYTSSYGRITQKGTNWWSVGCAVSNRTGALRRVDASTISHMDNLALSWGILGLGTVIDACLIVTARLERHMCI